MWIRYVLRYYVARFACYLRLWPNDLDALTAWAGWRLHNIHKLVAGAFPLYAKFTIVLWEDIGLWTKVEIIGCGVNLLCSLNILPHKVFAAHLEALREMIYLLVFWGNLELFWLAKPCPENVPLCATWWYNANTSCFHCVHHWVVDVRRIVDLEAQSHVLVHHPVLMDDLNL